MPEKIEEENIKYPDAPEPVKIPFNLKIDNPQDFEKKESLKPKKKPIKRRVGPVKKENDKRNLRL